MRYYITVIFKATGFVNEPPFTRGDLYVSDKDGMRLSDMAKPWKWERVEWKTWPIKEVGRALRSAQRLNGFTPLPF